MLKTTQKSATSFFGWYNIAHIFLYIIERIKTFIPSWKNKYYVRFSAKIMIVFWHNKINILTYH